MTSIFDLLYMRKFSREFYFWGIFFFANSVKRHICDVKNSRLGYDLPTPVNVRMILPFREGFIFTKLSICEVSRNKTLASIRIYSNNNLLLW